MATKPILCLDFDGVIHSYTSGWKSADVVTDGPTAGAMRFIWDAAPHFRIAVYSSRSGQKGGIRAMKSWLAGHFRAYWAADRTTCEDILAEIEWPKEKPPAFLTIDDRAIQFDGDWSALDPKTLLQFKPWNKRDLGATGQFPMGQLSDEDEGELKMGVARDPLDGLVHVNFGKPTAWFAMPPEGAISLAKLLLKNAGVKRVELEL